MSKAKQCHFQSYIDSPNRLCLTADLAPITFRDFWCDVLQQKQAIAQLKTQHWALWQSDSYEFLVLMFAALLAEKKLILPPNRVRDLEQQFAAQGIAFLARQPVTNMTTNNAIQAEALQTLCLDDVFLNAAELVFYTSGSTGAAKEIPRTLKQLLNEVQGLADCFTVQKDVVMLATVSHQHIYGLLFKLLWPLATGNTFYLPQLAFPEDVLAMQSKLQAMGWKNYCVSSPALLKRWGSQLGMQHSEGIFSSGGKLDSGVRINFAPRLVEVFGSSETGGIAFRAADDAPWQVFANVQIEIQDQQLKVRSSHAYSDQWVLTGDRAVYVDAQPDTGAAQMSNPSMDQQPQPDTAPVLQQAHFRLLGRVDRIVKLEEKRLSLDAIEQAIVALDEISQCVVMLHRLAQRDHLVCVAVLNDAVPQTLSDKTALVAKLKSALKHALESIAIPRQWRFLSEMPVNSQSKLNKQYLTSLFEPMLLPVQLAAHQADADQLSLKLEFPVELKAFKGHFKDYPVYPGVAQVAFIQHFAIQTWPDLAWCNALEQVKFQDLIRPATLLELHLQRSGSKVSFKLLQDDLTYASGRLSFEQCPAALAE